MKVIDGRRLRRWRLRREMSQRDVAYLCRCSQTTIYLLETGGMPTCSESLALGIAHVLDVPWEDVFERRDSARARRTTSGVVTAHRAQVPA